MKKIKENKYKVVRLSSTEFELENGYVFPLYFELEKDITIEQFQKHINKSKIIHIILNKLNKSFDNSY